MTDDWDDMRQEVTEPCRFLNPGEVVNYIRSDVTPSSYRCSSCRKTNIKLWRLKDTPLSHQMLYCISCMAAKSRSVIKEPRPNGQFWNGRSWTYETNQLVPAIPTPRNDTFSLWDANIPQAMLAWWQGLALA